MSCGFKLSIGYAAYTFSLIVGFLLSHACVFKVFKLYINRSSQFLKKERKEKKCGHGAWVTGVPPDGRHV